MGVDADPDLKLVDTGDKPDNISRVAGGNSKAFEQPFIDMYHSAERISAMFDNDEGRAFINDAISKLNKDISAISNGVLTGHIQRDHAEISLLELSSKMAMLQEWRDSIELITTFGTLTIYLESLRKGIPNE